MKISVSAANIADAKKLHSLFQPHDPPLNEDDWDAIKAHLVYSCHCPVALALRDAGFNMPVVMATKVTLDTADWTEADLPKSAQKFIRAYDNKKDVQPFNFVLKGVAPPEPDVSKEADVATG